MIRSSLVKSACVAIALSGFSPPQAGAIEMQGSNPTPMLNDGMISKAYIAHRGVTAVGPRGGVYHRGGPRWRLSGGRLSRRGLSWRRLSRRLSWRRGLPRRIWRLGAARLVSLGTGRRDCSWRGCGCARRRGGGGLRGLGARAGAVLVLYRPELSARLLGRLLAAKPIDVLRGGRGRLPLLIRRRALGFSRTR